MPCDFDQPAWQYRVCHGISWDVATAELPAKWDRVNYTAQSFDGCNLLVQQHSRDKSVCKCTCILVKVISLAKELLTTVFFGF